MTENIQDTDNNITLNLLRVNEEEDAIASNNSADYMVNLENSTHDIVTFTIIGDDFPQETSWIIEDELTGDQITSGSFNAGNATYSDEFCVDYNSCFSVTVLDSFGDGICCTDGEGNFSITSASGQLLSTNNGDFTSEAVEYFCPSGQGCQFTTEIESTLTSGEFESDGSISLNTTGGFNLTYSIDGCLLYTSDAADE